MLGKTDQEDPSVLRLAASLAAKPWSKSQSVRDDADVIGSDLENSHIDSVPLNGTALTSTVCC